HRRRPKVVHAAKDSAEGRLMGDELQGVVGVGRRGNVRQGERDAGDDLEQEGKQRRAAKHVIPSRVFGHGVPEDRPQDLRDPGPVVEGPPYPPYHTHCPGPQVVMGIGLVWISTCPPRTRTGYWGSGFGGGPAATAPFL